MKKKINFLLAGLLLIISFSAVADEMRFQKPYIQLNGGTDHGCGSVRVRHCRFDYRGGGCLPPARSGRTFRLVQPPECTGQTGPDSRHVPGR